MPDEPVSQVGDLLAQATGAYTGGDTRQAVGLLDEAIATARAGEPEALPYVLVQKAGWLRESGHPSDAEAALGDAIAEVERLPAEGHETEWSGLRMEQGLAAQRRGDFEAAGTFLAEAETFAGRSPARDLLLPDVYANKAALCLSQARLSEAQDALLAALEIDQRVGNKRSESNDLNMLGLVSQHLGDTDTARVYYTRAFEVAQEAQLVKEALDAMDNLTALLDDQGEHQRAAEMFKQIGDARAQGGDDSGLACSVANQGVAAAQAGHPEQAIVLFTRSRELHLAAGNQLHAVQDLLNLSGAEGEVGHSERALSFALEALAGAREFGLVEMLWQAEYVVAAARQELVFARPDDGAGPGDEVRPGNTGQADDEARRMAEIEKALAGYRQAADIIELLRANVDRPEERESLFVGKERVYNAAITLCLGLGRRAEAFQFCERARMRSFLEALGESRVEQLESADPAASRRADLVERLLSPATPAGSKPGLLDELRTMRAEAIARRPAVAAITEAELPTEAEIRAALPADTCLLDFFAFGNTVVSFLLDRDGLRDCQAVVISEPLAEVVARFRREIEDSDSELTMGHYLFAALIRPVMPHLATVAKLIVVPHSALHYVPFSSLWFEPAGDDAPPRQYLKNRFFLTTVPSAGYLPYLARVAAQTQVSYGAPVVLGDPGGDLQGAETEARDVAAKLGVAPCLGAQATRAALLGAAAPAVLHVAAHGTYDETDPLLSGLRLADGVVTVEDLLTSGSAPGLFVLSGCVTGLSERKPGDELVGLAQAALRRGTRAVIATLWETLDESSSLFFHQFYGALMEGVTVSEALAWGREALATGPGGFDQPVDWAPFVLIGDPDHRVSLPDDAPRAAFLRGIELQERGDTTAALAVYRQVADSTDHDTAGRAAYALGILLYEAGDEAGAAAAFRRAASLGDAELVPMAEYRAGQLLHDAGDLDEAQAAYQRAIDSGHADAAPRAALDLGALLAERGDAEGARAAYQRAIDAGHPEASPKAAGNLGVLLSQLGDIEGAQAAYQAAADSGYPEIAPTSALRLGTMLAEHGDASGARTALEQAIASGDSFAAPRAAYNLGILLLQGGDREGAMAALRTAASGPDPEMVRKATALMTELTGA
jgi:CHAT domain-containing protein/Flp pilus assembly protein TadD